MNLPLENTGDKYNKNQLNKRMHPVLI